MFEYRTRFRPYYTYKEWALEKWPLVLGWSTWSLPNLSSYIMEICGYLAGNSKILYFLPNQDVEGNDVRLRKLYFIISSSLNFCSTLLTFFYRFALLYIYVATVLCIFVLLCMGRCQSTRRGRRNSK